MAKAKKPPRATVKQTFQVKPELLDAARGAAVADGITLTEVVNEALSREVKRRAKRRGGNLPKAPRRLRPGVRLRRT